MVNKKEVVVGVHIGNDKTKNYAVRLTQEKRKMINGWVGKMKREMNLGKCELT